VSQEAGKENLCSRFIFILYIASLFSQFSIKVCHLLALSGSVSPGCVCCGRKNCKLLLVPTREQNGGIDNRNNEDYVC
jgi:hypothetical protein